MTSLDAQCLSTGLIVTQSILEDKNWRAFGYKRRPRRGSLFLRFVGKPKIERETTLMHELWGASFSTIFCWALATHQFKHRVAFIAKLMEYGIDGLNEPLWTALQFGSRRDAVEFLERACCDYGAVQQNDRSRVFIERCIASMTQQPPKEWLVGTVFLFSHPSSMMFNTARAMTDTGVADNSNNDIEVVDQEFLSIAEKLISKNQGRE